MSVLTFEASIIRMHWRIHILFGLDAIYIIGPNSNLTCMKWEQSNVSMISLTHSFAPSLFDHSFFMPFPLNWDRNASKVCRSRPSVLLERKDDAAEIQNSLMPVGPNSTSFLFTEFASTLMENANSRAIVAAQNPQELPSTCTPNGTYG